MLTIVIMKKLIIILSFLFVINIAHSNEKQINYAIQMCQQDMQQFSASGLSVQEYLSFCRCYMTGMIKALDDKEKAYQSKYQKPSGKYLKKAKKLKTNCTQ